MTDLITFLQAQVEIKERRLLLLNEYWQEKVRPLTDNVMLAQVKFLQFEIESIKEQIEIKKNKI